MTTKILKMARALRDDKSGLALIEFAYSLTFLIPMVAYAGELANYATVKMRISQVALHIADNGSRIGEGSLLSAKRVNEAQINDLLTGAGLQAGGLSLYTNGRVYVSSVEPVAKPNTTNRFKISWQRCRGSASYASNYGVAGTTNLTGIGPTGRQAVAPDDGAVMFAQVSYRYQPLFGVSWSPPLDIQDIAAMLVRDTRDFTQVYPVSGVTASSCT
jgi:Flp pilus assembly protein TadG